jgi:hypothetical protein
LASKAFEAPQPPEESSIGISLAYGAAEEVGSRQEIAHGLRTLPALFAVINSVVAAVLAGVIALELVLVSALVVGAGVGVVVFVGLFILQLWFGLRSIGAFRLRAVTYFPTPSSPDRRPDPEA